ncbi:ribonuclease III [Altererythrobacter arenosus]|uniref:Ribonuclease 3 n=1 Tax=Altererythrobacter arenosus TaxID=3032592 RepID=A0ABY8FQK0_9SPHN|nr:ribonuclease III [Altererythrobacter sp. CAU 1644]WFL77289.1 ribonuclease III [Altererythrobacter sp. CAU 1644]
MSGISQDTRDWLAQLGVIPQDDRLWLAALTHGSYEADRNYERLEFLGDRVLGLSIAEWLYAENNAPEGKLSQRLNALVSGATCARVARSIGLPDHIRLGKQAREDGARDSDNILGDVMEALLGAHFLDHGFEPTRDLVRRLWADVFAGDLGERKHPKSALQEWAAGNRRKPPEYELVARDGPDHAARFTVRVSVLNVGSAEATASNKQEAEKLAAEAFMEQFG